MTGGAALFKNREEGIPGGPKWLQQLNAPLLVSFLGGMPRNLRVAAGSRSDTPHDRMRRAGL